MKLGRRMDDVELEGARLEQAARAYAAETTSPWKAQTLKSAARAYTRAMYRLAVAARKTARPVKP